MSDFLTLGDVLGIHAILLQRYGGMDGVRDIRALESAIFRPQSGYYADVVEEAACSSTIPFLMATRGRHMPHARFF